MSDEREQDRTQSPTPRRRREAREEGQVAVSADLTASALLLGVLLVMSALGPRMLDSWRQVALLLLGGEELARRPEDLDATLRQVLVLAGGALLPLLAAALGIAVIVNLAQTGLVIAPRKLLPRLDHLDPARGMARTFGSSTTYVRLLMSLAKIGAAAIVGALAVRAQLPRLLSLGASDTAEAAAVGAAVVIDVGLKVACALLVLAVLDYAWQRWLHERALRMTRQEVRDELRRTEGDVQIKARRRQASRKPAPSSTAAAVTRANVVVIDPGRLAVALRYDPQVMPVAVVTARGAGSVAQRIVEAAAAAGVPAVERPRLASALHQNVEVGGEIPEDQFAAVADLLAYAERIRQQTRATAAEVAS